MKTLTSLCNDFVKMLLYLLIRKPVSVSWLDLVSSQDPACSICFCSGTFHWTSQQPHLQHRHPVMPSLCFPFKVHLKCHTLLSLTPSSKPVALCSCRTYHITVIANMYATLSWFAYVAVSSGPCAVYAECLAGWGIQEMFVG